VASVDRSIAVSILFTVFGGPGILPLYLPVWLTRWLPRLTLRRNA